MKQKEVSEFVEDKWFENDSEDDRLDYLRYELYLQREQEQEQDDSSVWTGGTIGSGGSYVFNHKVSEGSISYTTFSSSAGAKQTMPQKIVPSAARRLRNKNKSVVTM